MYRNKQRLEFNPNNLIWIDLEMTGLDPENEKILEIAVVVTPSSLETRIVGPSIAINQDSSVLDGMDKWNHRTHGTSGLLKRVEDSLWCEETAEEEILSFLRQYVPAGVSPMCGNVLGRDRRFLAKYMPALHDYFHYSDLDSNGLEIMAKRWGHDFPVFVKQNAHNALTDIHEAIDKMCYYRGMVFR